MINNKKVKLFIPILLMLFVVFNLNDNDSPNQSNTIESPYDSNKEVLNQNKTLEMLYKSKTSGVFVTFKAKVINILSDDNDGSRHQRLILEHNNMTVLLAHNIDVADRVPVKKNDTITVNGQYEWNDKGGVVHWTHKKDNNPYGWVMYNNKKYH